LGEKTQKADISKVEERLKNIIKKKAPSWVEEWDKASPGFLDQLLQNKREEVLKLSFSDYYEFSDNLEQMNLRRKYVFVYSPDKTKALDPELGTEIIKKGNKIERTHDIDSGLEFIDLERKRYARLMYFGTTGGINKVFWLNNNTFAVIWHHMVSHEFRNETSAPVVSVYYLKENKILIYEGPEVSWKLLKHKSLE